MKETEAISLAMKKGREFIYLFHNIYNSDNISEISNNLIKMEEIFDFMKTVEISNKNTTRLMNKMEFIDWFFTAASTPSTIVPKMTEKEEDDYCNFFIDVLYGESFEKAFNKIRERNLKDTSIQDMAVDRKTAKRICTSFSKRILEHFLKCYRMPNNDSFEHWTDELGAFIDDKKDIKLKPNNDRIKNEDLVSWLFLNDNKLNVSSLSDDEKKSYEDFYKNIVYNGFNANEAILKIIKEKK